MEFFICSCPEKGTVVLDGNIQGPNKDQNGVTRTLQCGAGLHRIALTCLVGKTCRLSPQEVLISDTNPILPQEVAFQCAP